MPTAICQQCIDRIQEFHKFFSDVTDHQQLLQLSKLKESTNDSRILTTPSNLIQLSPAIVSKSNGTLIITLRATSTSTNLLNTNEDIIISKDDTTEVLETEINSTSLQIINDSKTIEQELDELTIDDITADIRSESDTEDQCNDDNDNERNDENTNDLKNKFKYFPKKLIEDSKLLYKGKDLLRMISKFYTLECDICKYVFVFLQKKIFMIFFQLN